MIAKRFEGDHITVSTTESLLTPEISEISLNWIHFALYGDISVGRAFSENPCVGFSFGHLEYSGKEF